ncbi:MAG TPA: hypothetical protein VNO55_15215 [Polyangia bacterium]|nr:hypothetical protein [Polyangia bacterium]
MSWRRATLALLGCALTTTALSCRQVTPEITAVRIAVKTSSAFDQLEFVLTIAGVDVLPKTKRPTVAGTTLSGTQDFVVYLDDDKAGMNATCTVTALLHGDPGLTSMGMTPVIRRRVSECPVTLATDAGMEAGATESGATETGAMETAAPETGTPETGAPETSAIDASGPDAGPPDVSDAGGQDAADVAVDSPPEPARDGGLLDLNLLDLLGL